MPPPIKTQLYISDLEALVCQIQNAQSNPLLYDDQIVVKYPRSKLTVKFGRIENQLVERNTLVILSINEDFDLSCIQKSNTALGAYCSKIYGDAEQAINVIKEQIPHQREANEPVFIDSNTDARASIMLAPVVKSDPEAGNIASPGLIFEMVRRARKYMLNNNTKQLIMPLLGTGQANIDKSMSFVTTLLAIQQTEILKANNIDEVSIVIFQQSTSSVPEIEKSDVFAMLETLVANSVIKH
jgi:hypothetical protein